MMRSTLLAMLFAAAAPAVHAADEPGFCKSMCGSERQACKATARKMTGNDDLLERSQSDKNPFANTAIHAQGQSEQERIAGNDSFHRRQSERFGACEDTYLRCTRTCTVQGRSKRGS